MPKNPPKGYPRLMPYLLYEDSDAAIEFLARAFGFTERYRMTGDDGRVNHAELNVGDDAVVMLGTPGTEYKNPSRLGGSTCSIYVYVDDVDAHFERAREAGGKILREPEDQFYGDRNCGVADPEGHEWYFATHVRDVSPEEMGAASTTGAAT
jgi:PhnB protein